MTFAAATMMAGILLAATACAGPAPSSAPAAAAETQSVVASASPAAATSAAVPTEVNGIPIKGRVNNGKGEYLQTTVADDDPAMTPNPAVVKPGVYAAYSPEDIAQAHRIVVRFVAEEGIDSTINGGDNTEEWWARNKDRMAPEWQDRFKAHMDSGAAFISRGSWPDGNPEGLSYLYSADKPRVSKRTLTTSLIRTEAGEDGTENLVIKVDVDYIMTLSNGAPVHVKGYMQPALRHDRVTGAWLITGMYTEYAPY